MSRAWDLNERVLSLAPGFPNAHELRAMILIASRRFEERGVESIEHAYALDPLSNFMLYDMGITLNSAGKPARAIEVLREGVASYARQWRISSRARNGALPLEPASRACAALERGRELTGTECAVSRYAGVRARGDGGGYRMARAAAFQSWKKKRRITQGSSMEIACAYAALGEFDVAYTWLERAFEGTVVVDDGGARSIRGSGRCGGTPRFETPTRPHTLVKLVSEWRRLNRGPRTAERIEDRAAGGRQGQATRRRRLGSPRSCVQRVFAAVLPLFLPAAAQFVDHLPERDRADASQLRRVLGKISRVGERAP